MNYLPLIDFTEPPKIQFAEGMTVYMHSNAQLICEIFGKKFTEVKWVHVPSNNEYYEVCKIVYCSLNLKCNNSTTLLR